MNDDRKLITKRQMRLFLAELFEHQALLLAGLIQREKISDRLAWEQVRILDASRCRVVRQFDQTRGRPLSSSSQDRTHPAINEFLRRLNKDLPDRFGSHPVSNE